MVHFSTGTVVHFSIDKYNNRPLSYEERGMIAAKLPVISGKTIKLLSRIIAKNQKAKKKHPRKEDVINKIL